MRRTCAWQRQAVASGRSRDLKVANAVPQNRCPLLMSAASDFAEMLTHAQTFDGSNEEPVCHAKDDVGFGLFCSNAEIKMRETQHPFHGTTGQVPVHVRAILSKRALEKNSVLRFDR